MLIRKRFLMTLILTFLAFTFSALPTKAQGDGYGAIVKHLKTNYQAKKVNIPFMWLARFAV